MLSYVVRRLLASIPTLLAVLTTVFIVVRIVPGDPATAILGDQATPAAIEALQAKLGLAVPLHQQYVRFLEQALTGDFGQSMVTTRPVVEEIAHVVPHTFVLTLAALTIGVITGVPLGVWAAIHRNGIVDGAVRVVSLAGLSFPVFVSGVFLLLAFALHWQIFPVLGTPTPSDGWVGGVRKTILPAVTLAIPMAAYLTRITRSSMLQVLGEDYIRTARAKGVPQYRITWSHALRNASLPVVTVAGLYFGNLIGNSVLTEIVFTRPGLGSIMVAALSQRDYTMLQGLMVVYSFFIVAVNLITDLLYGVIDPRVKIA